MALCLPRRQVSRRALFSGRTNLPPEVQYALTQKLRLAATGLTVSQIATSLHISRSTAKTRLLRVYEKLEAPNRSAAVAIALGRGLLRVSAAVA
jgi:DNA-binding NarL/FixJ family response regulator